MSSKTQPDEHVVLSEIEKVLASNPEFGVKRMAVVLKEQNPEWSLSEKRVTKLLKKHKEIKIALDGTESDDDSPSAAAVPSHDPWNVGPAPTHDPWNNTFTVDTVKETTAAPVKSAFNLEPVSEPVPAAAAPFNPWNAAPVHEKTFTETVKENATKAVKQVKETTADVVAATPGFVEQAKHTVVDAAEKVQHKTKDIVEDVKDKVEDIVEDAKDKIEDTKDDAPGFFEKVKHAAADAVEKVKDTAEDAVEKVKDTAEDVVEAIQDKTEDIVDAVKDKTEDAVEAVKDATSSAPSPWNTSVEDKSLTSSLSGSVKSATKTVSAKASAGVAAVKGALSSATTTDASKSAWNAAPVETPAYVAEPVKPVTTSYVAPVAEAPKKETWNFTPVKEEAAKVAEDLKAGAHKAESLADSALDKIEDAASAASKKVKEEAAAAVVVIKKAESAVEDKLAAAKAATAKLVGAGYGDASVATSKDKSSKRPVAEKEVEGSACGACSCVVM